MCIYTYIQNLKIYKKILFIVLLTTTKYCIFILPLHYISMSCVLPK